MPASKKQIKSNRQNAQKSTGPKTDQGKAKTSNNATTFGLYSKKIVIDSNEHSEDPVEYELLFESLKWELDPQSSFQEYLVRKITNCLWRSQRAAPAEASRVNKQLNLLGEYSDDTDESITDSNEISDEVGINLIPNKHFAKRILYYEMRLDRQLRHAYNLLRSLQHHDELLKKKTEANNKRP